MKLNAEGVAADGWRKMLFIRRFFKKKRAGTRDWTSELDLFISEINNYNMFIENSKV